jgi:hypothetical protein
MITTIQCYLVSNIKSNDLINMKWNKVEEFYITRYCRQGFKMNVFNKLFLFL